MSEVSTDAQQGVDSTIDQDLEFSDSNLNHVSMSPNPR